MAIHHLDAFRELAQERIDRYQSPEEKMREIYRIKSGDVCAEIGVWKGEFSERILRQHPSKLHLIDPWVHQDFPVDDPAELRIYCCEQKEMDRIYKDVVNKFAGNETVEIHREFSANTVFAEKYFDWVYVDGNHSYENVLEDLRHYLPFIKNGGLLCGDDYGANDGDPYSNGGPERAVQEFIEETGLEVEITGTQFCIKVS